MANSNCLEGIACPNCAQESHFFISARVLCEVTDNGSVVTGGDHYWDNASVISCPECGKIGKVEEFRKGERK